MKPTLIVSNGWPATTVQTPPKPPDRKYLMGLVLFSDMAAERMGIRCDG